MPPPRSVRPCDIIGISIYFFSSVATPPPWDNVTPHAHSPAHSLSLGVSAFPPVPNRIKAVVCLSVLSPFLFLFLAIHPFFAASSSSSLPFLRASRGKTIAVCSRFNKLIHLPAAPISKTNYFASTGSSKKNPAKFSDTCSVRADGLCIGCQRLVGRRKAGN